MGESKVEVAPVRRIQFKSRRLTPPFDLDLAKCCWGLISVLSPFSFANELYSGSEYFRSTLATVFAHFFFLLELLTASRRPTERGEETLSVLPPCTLKRYNG